MARGELPGSSHEVTVDGLSSRGRETETRKCHIRTIYRPCARRDLPDEKLREHRRRRDFENIGMTCSSLLVDFEKATAKNIALVHLHKRANAENRDSPELRCAEGKPCRKIARELNTDKPPRGAYAAEAPRD